MTGLQVVLLVVGILAVQVMIWVPVVLWIRRRTARVEEGLRGELAASGERVRLGPVAASYRGATPGSGLPAVKGNAVAALPDRRLIVRRLVGEAIELAVAEIASVRDDRWFLGSYRGGRPVVIVKTRADAELGVMVAEHEAWMSALRPPAS